MLWCFDSSQTSNNDEDESRGQGRQGKAERAEAKLDWA